MDFADNVLLRLASTPTRNALLSQAVLGTMVDTAFDTSTANVAGPYALDVEQLDLGVEIPRTATLEGTYEQAPGTLPGMLRLRVGNLQLGETLRVDSLWRGQLIARIITSDNRITAVSGGFALLDLDRAIEAALGALPVGVALETERRKELLKRLKAGALLPDVIDDAALNHMLAAAGVSSLADLVAQQGVANLGALRIRFTSAPEVEPPPVPVRLPVTVAVLVHNTLDGLSTLFAKGRAIAAALAMDPAAQPAAAQLTRRVPILQCWFVPGTLFDNADWPGATAAARASALTQLLSGQGIALASV